MGGGRPYGNLQGEKNIRYFVKDYENALFDFTQGEQAS